MRRHLLPNQLTFPSGHRAVYRDWGEGNPVVFLHGLMGSHRHWLGLMQGLKRQYRCVAIDLLGFGDSSESEQECGVSEQVAFVREVVQALDLDRYVLVGHSLGGWIAAEYSLLYQDEMAGLILAAPAGIRDRSFNRHYLLRWPLTWNTNWIDWGLGIASRIYGYFGQQDRLSPLLLERKEFLVHPTARWFVRARAFGHVRDRPIEPSLGRIHTPALVIAAESDRLIPRWCCEQYANKMQQAELQILSQASHRLPIEHWREMLPIVEKFLVALQDSQQAESVNNNA
ncbi:MAG: alpha/beta fold hydrolase [Synechococcus sp.]